jgi:hypothetical protein
MKRKILTPIPTSLIARDPATVNPRRTPVVVIVHVWGGITLVTTDIYSVIVKKGEIPALAYMSVIAWCPTGMTTIPTTARPIEVMIPSVEFILPSTEGRSVGWGTALDRHVRRNRR